MFSSAPGRGKTAWWNGRTLMATKSEGTHCKPSDSDPGTTARLTSDVGEGSHAGLSGRIGAGSKQGDSLTPSERHHAIATTGTPRLTPSPEGRGPRETWKHAVEGQSRLQPGHTPGRHRRRPGLCAQTGRPPETDRPARPSDRRSHRWAIQARPVAGIGHNARCYAT